MTRAHSFPLTFIKVLATTSRYERVFERRATRPSLMGVPVQLLSNFRTLSFREILCPVPLTPIMAVSSCRQAETPRARRQPADGTAEGTERRPVRGCHSAWSQIADCRAPSPPSPGRCICPICIHLFSLITRILPAPNSSKNRVRNKGKSQF